MAKTNYSYEKRQKEIAKKKKNEEKRLKKISKIPEKEQVASVSGDNSIIDSDS